jgi:small-conductance mechanosensitive channel/post-segregation antitoxin (ccd killing protein)
LAAVPQRLIVIVLMAKMRSISIAVALGVLLVGGLLGYLLTPRESNSNEPSPSPNEPSPKGPDPRATLVDETPLQRARMLLAIASTKAEQRVALETIQNADDEVDLALAMALALAQTRARSPILTGGVLALSIKLPQLEQSIRADQERIQRLEANTKSKPERGSNENDGQIEVAKAQLSVDQDKLESAKEDLSRASGDQTTQIQEELAKHQAREHAANNSEANQVKPSSFQVGGVTLWSHVEDWQHLHQKLKSLSQATFEARQNIGVLTHQHYAVEAQLDRVAAGREPTSDSEHSKAKEDPAATVKELQYEAGLHKVLDLSDKRIQDLQKIATEYIQWRAMVSLQFPVVWHAIFGSVLLILGIVLGVIIGLRIIDRLYAVKDDGDRRLLTTRISYRATLQGIGVVLMLLTIFGVPNQIATVLALAGAGLTVVLKDYIVGFFGWFTLAGREGMRVGDWVEINGVTGEVIEIGLVRTLLLETSSWNEAGHPTGRKVSFVNSFAIEGHYFNFTTGGQWLWDEIDVPVPGTEDPDRLAELIRDIVVSETAEYAASAEQEWRRATPHVAAEALSAAPGVDLRPSGSGLNLAVRYVTRAGGRRELRSRLYRAIVAALYGRAVQTEKA